MLDVVIKGGDVVDGTGAARRRADVGIKDGRIVQIGTIDDRGGAHDRRHRQARRPGLRRRAHPLRRAGLLGQRAHARRRCTASPPRSPGNCGFTVAPLVGRPERRRLPAADARPGRGHAGRDAAGRRPVELGQHGRLLRPHRVRRRRHQPRLHDRPLGDPPHRDGPRRHAPRVDARRARAHEGRSCAPASRPAASASPPATRAPTTTPTATWSRRGTRSTAELIELARRRRRVRGHRARDHPPGGPVRPVGDRPHGRHVGRRAATDQLERHGREPGEHGRLPGQARRRRRRPSPGRQGRRAHDAHQLRRSALVQQRVRARRDAGLGGGDARVTRREARAALRPGRTRRAERQGPVARQPAAHARRLGLEDHLRRRRPRERAVPRPDGRRRSPPPRAATHGTCSATSRSPTSSTPASARPTPVETVDDWKARLEVWRDPRRGDRRVGCRCALRPARLVQLRDRPARAGGPARTRCSRSRRPSTS